MIRKLEIEWDLPVELTDAEYQSLDRFIDRICKRHCPEGWAFWPAGHGSKPTFSQADSRFLGKDVDPAAPLTGEPTWDDSVYHIDCSARELSPEEIEQRKIRAMQAEERRARWDSRLSGWLHSHGMKRASWWIADLSFWIHRKRRTS